MTPERVSPTGSFRLEGRFGGYRFRHATGLTTLDEYGDLVALMRKLERTGRGAVLRALHERRVTFRDVLRADDDGALDGLAVQVELYQRIWDERTSDSVGRERIVPGAFSRAIAARTGAKHRQRMAVTAAKIRRLGLIPADAIVADLADLDYPRIRREWPGSASDYMHFRRFVSAALTHVFGGGQTGKEHPFRRRVMDRIPNRRERKRTPRLQPAQFRQIVAEAPPHVQAAYVTLVATGMRVGEYLALGPEHLRADEHVIEVPGTKTEASEREVTVHPTVWPWIVAAVPSPVRYNWLRIHWHRAVRAAKVTPVPRLHDLRHCHAQWAHAAGVELAVIRDILGHSTYEQTADYAAAQMRAEHAAKIAAAIGL